MDDSYVLYVHLIYLSLFKVFFVPHLMWPEVDAGNFRTLVHSVLLNVGKFVEKHGDFEEKYPYNCKMCMNRP
jgi:hypothetical protein